MPASLSVCVGFCSDHSASYWDTGGFVSGRSFVCAGSEIPALFHGRAGKTGGGCLLASHPHCETTKHNTDGVKLSDKHLESSAWITPAPPASLWLRDVRAWFFFSLDAVLLRVYDRGPPASPTVNINRLKTQICITFFFVWIDRVEYSLNHRPIPNTSS